MKVLNLQCAQAHDFEGWFASEEDFQGQLTRGILTCPLCGDHQIHKLPSAPRLNLGAVAPSGPESPGKSLRSSDGVPPESRQALQAAWLKLTREAMKNAEDVGDAFVAEARRIHRGESPRRGIRGQASLEDTVALVEEGVPVLPLPVFGKETLQ
ncbi:MAG: DUF1178 family protein [Curvibacter sp.]|nr:DUF1178 family protein [Curvibacter sp.]